MTYHNIDEGTMVTFQLSVSNGKYYIQERDYNGIEVNRTNMAQITPMEANALLESGLYNFSFGDEIPADLLTGERIEARELLSFEEEDGRYWLYIHLSANADLNRQPTKLVDPWHQGLTAPYSDRLSRLIRENVVLDVFSKAPAVPAWPDNPTEAIDSWRGYS